MPLLWLLTRCAQARRCRHSSQHGWRAALSRGCALYTAAGAAAGVARHIHWLWLLLSSCVGGLSRPLSFSSRRIHLQEGTNGKVGVRALLVRLRRAARAGQLDRQSSTRRREQCAAG